LAFAIAMTRADSPAPSSPGPQRTCIATGETGAPERMIRFVVGPDGEVVADLRRRLAALDREKIVRNLSATESAKIGRAIQELEDVLSHWLFIELRGQRKAGARKEQEP